MCASLGSLLRLQSLGSHCSLLNARLPLRRSPGGVNAQEKLRSINLELGPHSPNYSGSTMHLVYVAEGKFPMYSWASLSFVGYPIQQWILHCYIGFLGEKKRCLSFGKCIDEGPKLAESVSPADRALEVPWVPLALP